MLGFSELHFRLKDDHGVFQAEIFAILKHIKAIAGRSTSDSESSLTVVKGFWIRANPSYLGSVS